MKKILKFSFLFLIVFVFGSFFTSSAFAISENITQINFTSSPQTINSDTISEVISIQTQNSEGILEQTSETNHLNLISDSPTGEFSSNSTNWNPVNTLTMNTGTANRNFFYRDSTPGTHILTISAEGTSWTPATENITIVGDAGDPITLSSIAITTPANKLNYTVGDSLDITGLVVTGTYSDESAKIETITETDISGFDSSAQATGQVLTITIGGQTTTYTINIAATLIHLDIEANVDVPASCSATDTDGAIHDYPQGNSYLAICALVTAINNGSISSAQFSNQFPSLGLFVTAINDVTADPNSQYWAIYKNESFANLGLASLPVIAGDIIMLQLQDFSDNKIGDKLTLNIHSLVTAEVGGNGGGGGNNNVPTFSAENALAYLKSVQGADGSFDGSTRYTDWAAIAAVAGDNSSLESSISNYIKNNPLDSSIVTENERRVMALLSLDINPYSGTEINYIKKIIDSFDGTQFGETDLLNDDIFALIPLANAGYTSNDDEIIKDVAFVISKQKTNGSWEESVDITAAAIQALKSFDSIAGVSDAIHKASVYLKDTQNCSNGGWGNVFSTSWAMQAESALGALFNTTNCKTGLDYLATQQATNGAVLPLEDTFATSSAIPAGLGKPWSEIMQSVSKQTDEDQSIEQNNSSHTSSGFDSRNNTDNTLADVSENNNPPASTDPVICPFGHLFSVTTGQPCTINTPDSTGSPQANRKETEQPEQISQVNTAIMTTPTSDTALLKNRKIIVSEDLPANTKEITPDTLTATAINALPTNNIPKTLLIILGVLSGIVFLYFVRKNLVKNKPKK